MNVGMNLIRADRGPRGGRDIMMVPAAERLPAARAGAQTNMPRPRQVVRPAGDSAEGEGRGSAQ